jgi:starch phosphorylase
MNEGHSALLLVERLKGFTTSMSLSKAIERVKASSILTIHTPVAAGNERFDVKLMRPVLASLLGNSAIKGSQLEARAVDSEGTKGIFDLTALAIRFSRLQNGVSLLHGRTADGTWRKVAGQELIGLTNGVHMPTWLGPEMRALAESKSAQFHNATIFPKLDGSDWRGITEASDSEVWEAHRAQKERLIDFARRRIFEQKARHGEGPTPLREVLDQMNPEALTIGFARRFATYKRAHLLFQNPKRLAALLSDSSRPVQVVFAGKAHPADREGQALIAEIYKQTQKYKGKVFFLEDYDMETGRRLVQGVDIWLNNPRRPLEASGTSGMKAAANGVPNVSILDGWWDEACREGDLRNGWAIGTRETVKSESRQDKIDGNALYHVLENEVIPLFFDRSGVDRLPRGWIKVMKESMASSLWQFSTARMLLEYEARMVNQG